MTNEFEKFCVSHSCSEDCKNQSDYCPIADEVRNLYGGCPGGEKCENVFILGARGAGEKFYIKTVILPDLLKQAGYTTQDFSDEEIDWICYQLHRKPVDECIKLIIQIAKEKTEAKIKK